MRTAAARRRATYARGRTAEAAALAALLLKGYRPLARRYCAAGGEIDLVMMRGDVIAFVEAGGAGLARAQSLGGGEDLARRRGLRGALDLAAAPAGGLRDRDAVSAQAARRWRSASAARMCWASSRAISLAFDRAR